RMAQAERQHGHQTLAAGKSFGVVTRSEKLHGFGQRRGARVIERRQFHGPVAAFRAAPNKRIAYLSSDRGGGQRNRRGTVRSAPSRRYGSHNRGAGTPG